MGSAEVHSGLEKRTQHNRGINPYQLHTHLLCILTRCFLCYRLWITIPVLGIKRERERGEISLTRIEVYSIQIQIQSNWVGLPWFGCSSEGCSSSSHRLWLADFCWGWGKWRRWRTWVSLASLRLRCRPSTHSDCPSLPPAPLVPVQCPSGHFITFIQFKSIA